MKVAVPRIFWILCGSTNFEVSNREMWLIPEMSKKTASLVLLEYRLKSHKSSLNIRQCEIWILPLRSERNLRLGQNSSLWKWTCWFSWLWQSPSDELCNEMLQAEFCGIICSGFSRLFHELDGSNRLTLQVISLFSIFQSDDRNWCWRIRVTITRWRGKETARSLEVTITPPSFEKKKFGNWVSPSDQTWLRP